MLEISSWKALLESCTFKEVVALLKDPLAVALWDCHLSIPTHSLAVGHAHILSRDQRVPRSSVRFPSALGSSAGTRTAFATVIANEACQTKEAVTSCNKTLLPLFVIRHNFVDGVMP